MLRHALQALCANTTMYPHMYPHHSTFSHQLGDSIGGLRVSPVACLRFLGVRLFSSAVLDSLFPAPCRLLLPSTHHSITHTLTHSSPSSPNHQIIQGKQGLLALASLEGIHPFLLHWHLSINRRPSYLIFCASALLSPSLPTLLISP